MKNSMQNYKIFFTYATKHKKIFAF
jgi:hypothetical protein